MSAAIGPDEIAEALLATESLFEPDEWGAIEDDAFQLLVEGSRSWSRLTGARGGDPGESRPRATRLDTEDRRIDLATAAALVYLGRIV